MITLTGGIIKSVFSHSLLFSTAMLIKANYRNGLVSVSLNGGVSLSIMQTSCSSPSVSDTMREDVCLQDVCRSVTACEYRWMLFWPVVINFSSIEGTEEQTCMLLVNVSYLFVNYKTHSLVEKRSTLNIKSPVSHQLML